MELRKLTTTGLVTVAMAAVAWAATFANWTSPACGSNDGKLTIQGAAGDTLTIPGSATIKVKDAHGVEMNPQPYFKLNPNKGTGGSSHTITAQPPGTTFPSGATVTISQIDSSGSAEPTGAWSYN